MIVKKFEEIAAQFPGNVAVKAGKKELTYFRLNQTANRLAMEIEQGNHPHNKKSGTVTVGLLFEHCLEVVVAILGVLKTNKVYVPLDVTYPEDRLFYMLKDAEINRLLTNDRNMALAQKLAMEAKSEKGALKIINVDALNRDMPGNFKRIPSHDGLAYILYTSGSTGKPKGVVQTHRNVLYYIKNWVSRFSINPGDRLTLLTALSHDGAVQDIFSALLTGATLYPYNIKDITDLAELTQWLSQEKISLWHSVPTLFRYFAATLGIHGKKNFSHLRCIILGGEQLRVHDIDLCKTFFPGAALASAYGQTESSVNTLMVINPGETNERLNLGDPLDETDILLINHDGEITEDMETGELIVASAYISPGYWNDPQQTRRVFSHDPALGKLYFTGDLGRRLFNDRIEFLGRRDSQVKIRGFRVETGEIETRLLKHQGVKEAVVMDREDENGDKYLCAYLVPAETHKGKPGTPADLLIELRAFLALQLPGYMIPAYFIRIDKMPLTSSNKINKRMLPEPNPVDGFKRKYAAPRDKIEEKLVEIWSKDLEIEKNSIGIDSSYFELGGHSLKAISLIAQIYKKLEVKVSLVQVFNTPTIKRLAEYVRKEVKTRYRHIEKIPGKEFYELSPAQRRLFILRLMEPRNLSYNMTRVVIIEGNLDYRQLETAFAMLIKRHESLRTSFHLVDGEPRQKIHEEVEFEIKYNDLPSADPQSVTHIIENVVQPYDLSRAPLLRVGLIRDSAQKHILVVDLHHIVTDGTSNQLLVQEFTALYENMPLTPLRIQYKDFAAYRNRLGNTREIKKQEKYWLDKFFGEIPVLELPLDYPRPQNREHNGGTFHFSINKELRTALQELERKGGATLFMVLLALYNTLLMRYSNQADTVVGTVTAGRTHPDLESMVGVFITTLALRNNPEPGKRFIDFLAEVKENCLESFDNSDYPFEELVERVKVERTLNRNPLFDTMLLLQNFERPPIYSGGLLFKPYPYKANTSIFDLQLTAVEIKTTGAIHIEIKYAANLFKPGTIERLARHYLNMIKEVTGNDRKTLGNIQLLSEEEKDLLLYQLNPSQVEYPRDKTLAQIMEEQVEKTPDQVALRGLRHSIRDFILSTARPVEPGTPTAQHVTLTYRELNERSNQLTHLLNDKGIKPGTLVGIMVNRSIKMIIAILAVLKAGAAYLPIAADYPENRVKYILEDSGTTFLLSRKSTAKPFAGLCRVIDPEDEHTYRGSGRNQPGLSRRGSNLAYVTYTSGSTGKPKGVIIENRSVINFINGITDIIPFAETSRLLSLTTISFDIFGLETLLPMTRGSLVVLGTEEEQLNPEAAVSTIKREKITTFQLTPSRLQLFIDHPGAGPGMNRLKYLLVGGEAFQETLLTKVRAVFDGKIFNLYGPTETTIWSTLKELTGEESLNIGKPLANTLVYILTPGGALQPLGVPGELSIAGDGVARGYLNRPELTAEKFCRRRPGNLFEERFPGPSPNFLSDPSPIYRTGDQARWLPDGNIEFIGRLDHQVKIRGHRIEPGEIVNWLLKYRGIKEAVVYPQADDGGVQYLGAYIVLEDEINPSPQANFDLGQLREFLSRYLPNYMIPLKYVVLERIPWNASGKIDRKALPGLETIGLTPVKPVQSYPPPGTETEKRVAETWQEILKLDQVGIYDNFFDLGGNSFNIIKLNNRLCQVFNEDIQLLEMFKYPTVHTFSAFLDREVTRGSDNETALTKQQRRFEIIVNTNKLLQQKIRN